MPRQFLKVTGKIPEAPECPHHKGVGLMPELRTKSIGRGVENLLWRCPKDHAIYQEITDTLT